MSNRKLILEKPVGASWRRVLKSNTCLCTGLAVLSLVVVPTLASAQISEMVVTVRKRAESVQEIPTAVTVFSDEQITGRGISDVGDIAKFTTGLTFDEGFSPQDTRLQIRGLPATRGKPPVGVLLDGIDISSEAIGTAGGGTLVNLRLLDTERVEVVKGPHSALYGRNAFGGAINYVSKQPSDEFSGDLNLDVGGDGQFEVRGAVSGPVGETGLSLRLSAGHAEHDGFYENSVSGSDIGGFESDSVSLAAKFEASDDLTINGRIAWSDDEYDPAAMFNLGGGTGITSDLSIPTAANTGGVTTSTSATVGRIGSLGSFDHPIALSIDPRTQEDYPGSSLETVVASLHLDWDIGSVTFQSWTGYTKGEAFQFLDIDQVGLPPIAATLPLPGGTGEPLNVAQEFNVETETEQFSQEFRLSGPEDGRFRWAIGALYWDEDVDQVERNLSTALFSPTASAGLNTLLANAVVPPGVGLRETEHWSVYALTEFDFSDRWTLGVEARYAQEDYTYTLDSALTALGVGITPVAVSAASRVRGTIEEDDNFFTPRVSLEYQVNDDVLLYGSVAKGVKPGGVSTLSFFGSFDGKSYDSEELWNYELGVKSSVLDDTLVLNGAVFYQVYEGKQFNTQEVDPANPVGISSVVRNLGEAEILGLEFEAAWSPTPEFLFTAGYTWLDTEYTDFTFNSTSSSQIARAGVCDPIVLNGVSTCSITLDGNQLERAPEHSFAASASYTGTITADIDWMAELVAVYEGERYLDFSQRWELDSYWIADARLGVMSENWSAFVYAENIFEDDTVRNAQDNFDLFNFGTSVNLYAPPKRQIGVRLGYAW